jgi:hypothetical protein
LPQARLHDIAHHDIFNLLGPHVRALDRLGDRDPAELGRGNLGQPAEELPDRRANGGENEGFNEFSP